MLKFLSTEIASIRLSEQKSFLFPGEGAGARVVVGLGVTLGLGVGLGVGAGVGAELEPINKKFRENDGAFSDAHTKLTETCRAVPTKSLSLSPTAPPPAPHCPPHSTLARTVYILNAADVIAAEPEALLVVVDGVHDCSLVAAVVKAEGVSELVRRHLQQVRR